VHIGFVRYISMHQIVLIACFTAAAGLYFFLRGFQLFARKRSLERVQIPAIRDANPQFHVVSGRASGSQKLSAPVSGQACYLYRTSVFQRGESGQKTWTKVAEEIQYLPFFVEDSTGRLLIDPAGAELDLPGNFHEESSRASLSSSQASFSSRAVDFLARHEIAQDRPTRIAECFVQPDDSIFITGTICENRRSNPKPASAGKNLTQDCDLPQIDLPGTDLLDTDSPGKEPANPAQSSRHLEVVRLSGATAPSSTLQMTQQSKIAAALDRAGLAQPGIWTGNGPLPIETGDDASETQLEPAVAPVKSASGNNGNGGNQQRDAVLSSEPCSLTISQGAGNATFVISSHDPRALTGSLDWTSVALIVGGSLLTVLGLGALLLQRELH